MTDKIITTFETTLTWYCPTDKLPDDKSLVLIKPKDEDNEIEIKTVCFKSSYNFLNNIFVDLDTNLHLEVDYIEWWAYLPRFEEL